MHVRQLITLNNAVLYSILMDWPIRKKLFIDGKYTIFKMCLSD